MAKFGNFLYGTAKYGEAATLAYSVKPMSITVLDFSKVYITWTNPVGNFTKIKLLRNQISFPETAEDGIVVWQENATEGNISRTYFTDGEDNLGPSFIPISTGRPIFYSMFLFDNTDVWVKAGDISDIIPTNYNSQRKFLDILPRVYTSDIQSPLGVVDRDSILSKFLSGMSFTYEQFLTQLDLLRPRHTADISSHLLLSSEFFSIGLTPEPSISVRNQKILAREGLYLYSHKGLKDGVGTYVESLTGYAPDITVSTNLMLTVQDSTFYKSVGNWTATNATLSASLEQVPATGTNVIDTEYTCKIVASGSGNMSLDGTDAVRKGVPVNEETEYVISSKIKSPASAGNMTVVVYWYDMNGKLLSSSASSSVSANNTWKDLTTVKTSPTDASYATLSVTYSAAGTYYLDQVCFQLGDTAHYDEARAITVFVNPNKTNWVENPSFEVNVTDNWTLAGSATAAQDTDIPADVFAGTYSSKVTGTGSWTYTSNSVAIDPGIYYVASGYVKSTAELSITLVGRDSTSTVVTSASPVTSLGTPSDWTRFQAVVLVDAQNPLDVQTYELEFSGDTGDFYLDSIQFEKGISATEYFDGSLPSDFGAVWEGTTNNSYTRLYVGKPYKISRLSQTLSDWMPPNTFWRLSSYDGIEATGWSSQS